MSIRRGNKIIAGTGGGGGGTNVLVDDKTIVKNSQDIITAVGVQSKTGETLYDWIGTQAEYSRAVTDGTIQENWVCYITDDGDITPGYGFSLFDTKIADHILEGQEAKGWALQGTYVYKESLADRVGYPDFYNKCLEEYQNSTEEVIGLEPWTQPVATANSTAIDGGNMVTSASSEYTGSAEYAWKAMDGNTTSTHFSLSSTNTGWWQVKFPYKLLIKGLTYYSRAKASTYPVETATFYTSSDMTQQIGDTFSAPTTDYTAFEVQNIPQDGVITDTIYLSLKGSGSTCGMGELVINAQKLTTDIYYTIYKNNNGHKFYPIEQKSVFDAIYNQCGIADFYGIDEENERIFLPRNKYFQQLTLNTSEVNEMVEAGLPNITGSTTTSSGYGTVNGAFNRESSISGNGANSHSNWHVSFDASRSNPIYGNSDTVQPPSSLKLLYYCVGNTSSISSLIDIKDITTTENDTIPLLYSTYQSHKVSSAGWLKADNKSQPSTLYPSAYTYLEDLLAHNPNSIPVVEVGSMVEGEDYTKHFKVDLTNQTFTLPIRTSERVLVAKKEATDEDNTWYNLYSDGWCEQGGLVVVNSTSDILNKNVLFIKPYISLPTVTTTINSYTLYTSATNTPNGNSIAVRTGGINTVTTDGFNFNLLNTNIGEPFWQASGYTQIPTLEEYTEPLNLYFKVGNAVQHLEVIDMLHQADLNKPYFLGMSEYFENTPNNLSWLKSEGQWNSKDIYVSYYEWLEEQYNEGNENVKLVTEEYDDYNFVINQEEGTFRLPLLDGSESLLSDRYIDLTLGASGDTYTAPANGWYAFAKAGSSTNSVHQYNGLYVNRNGIDIMGSNGSCPVGIGSIPSLTLPIKKGDVVRISYTTTGDLSWFRFIYAQGNGSLYYYVGETVQNANLINAGRLSEVKANKTDVDGQWVAKSLVLMTNYTANSKVQFDLSDYLPNDSYIYEVLMSATGATDTTSGNYVAVYVSTDVVDSSTCIFRAITRTSSAAFGGGSIILPVSKIITIYNTGQASSGTNEFKLIAYRRLGTNA